VRNPPPPAAGPIASGDYTTYGHTDYIPAILVLPRLVWDTTHGLDSARVVDSVRAIQKPVLRAGLAAGLSQWPEDLWGACEAVSGLGRSRT